MINQLEEKVMSKMMWGVKEISKETDLSVPFLRAEIRRGSLATRKVGRRVLVACDDLWSYLRGDESLHAPDKTNPLEEGLTDD